MFQMISMLERTALATLAVALSAATLLAATVAPMHADAPDISATSTPVVETVLVSYEPASRATRLN